MVESREKKVILLVGGLGYLGLYFLEDLVFFICDCILVYIYNFYLVFVEFVDKFFNVLVFYLDFCSGEGL